MGRKWKPALFLCSVFPLASAAAGCATHDLNAVHETGPSADEIVPRSIRRLSTPVSPLRVASTMNARRSERGGPAAGGRDAQELLAGEGESGSPGAGYRDDARPGQSTRRDGGLQPVAGERPAPSGRANVAAASPGGLALAYYNDAEAPPLPVPPKPFDPQAEPGRDGEERPRPGPPPASRVRAHAQIVPIDFASALSMTAGKNPQVAFARERVDESLAQLLAAEALWLPSIRAGANYNKHEGRIQDVAGRVFETSRIASYAGLGARGVGAGSPNVPGLSMQFDLADAVFEPKAADRRSQALDRSARATLNDELLESAIAYLDLLDALQAQAILEETVSNSEELARLTSEFARTGQGTEADANRAATNLAIQRNRLTGADAAVVVASARLAQQLRLDPSALLSPAEPNVAPVCLVETGRPIKELIATGLSRRPELAANRLFVEEAIQRLKREKYSVLMPSVLVGMDYGGMGGGLNNEIVNSGERFDFDAVAYWEVRNFGFGEKAARDQAGSRVDQARLRTLDTMDNIAREVVQYHAQVEAARDQIEVAREAVESAGNAYRRDLQRIKEGQGLPIETLQSLLALDAAQREYLRATIEHNKAQFQLQRALGWPVR